jgi:hypothetical protein
MTPLFESVIGANWRTTVYGSVAVLAGTISAHPELVNWLPENIRGPVVGICGLICAVSAMTFAAVSKDARVSGNGTPVNPHNVNDGSSSVGRSIAPLLLALLIPLSLLTGCAFSFSADREYRRRIESQDFGVSGNYDFDTRQASGEFRTSVHFRDPDASGLRK